MSKPTAVVLGASADRSKFGNKSVRAHRQQGYAVYPVNPKGERIEGLPTYRSLAEVPIDGPDRITVYLPPPVAVELLAEIDAKKPAEVWFNPGTESPQLRARAEELGLPAVFGCSIVDLGLSPSELSAD